MNKLEINGKTYVTYGYIKDVYNLTAQRVKLWREGKGDAKKNKLDHIQVNRSTIFYNKEHIEDLIKLLGEKK
jgi:hypothetical protein